MDTTPDLGIPLVIGQQAQPEITHNEAIVLLQALLNGVIDRGINDPPDGSPTPQEGDAYIVGTAPTGAWAGRSNCLTVYHGTSWLFLPGDDDDGDPIAMGARQEGLRVWVRDEDAVYAWTQAGSPLAYQWVKQGGAVTAADVTYDDSASGGLGAATVKAALDALSAVRAAQAPVEVAGTSLTLGAAHKGRVVKFTSDSNITVTLPQQSTEALAEGYVATLIPIGDGSITLVTEGSDQYVAVEVGSPPQAGTTATQKGAAIVVTLLAVAGSPPVNTWHAEGRLA